jgi:hypothetical protein
MKVLTIVSALMITAALFTQSVAASTADVAQPAVAIPAVGDATAVTPQSPVVRLSQGSGIIESYADLVQRIKQESVRQLSEKLDTSELISELLGTTVRNFVEVTMRSAPPL